MLSVILVSYNSKEYLKKCLGSLEKEVSSRNAEVKAEVIVVDNGSTDGSVELVKKEFPKVKLIENKENIGFARANNQGAKEIQGEYLLFLNSDTEVKSGSLGKLVSGAKMKKAKIASCRLLNSDGSIQPQGGYLPRLSNILWWALFIDDLPIVNRLIKRYQERRGGFFKRDHQMGWVGGAAMLVEKQTWEELGGFDEKLFMYGEDVDFCWRASKEGIKVWYLAEPEIVHHGQKSGSSEHAVLGEYKGLKYVFAKHKPRWELPILRLMLKIGAILRVIVFGIIGTDAQKKKIYLKAFKLA